VGVVPHWLYPPPPQKAGEMHAPQLTTPPHPSLFMPQVKPWSVHDFGVHEDSVLASFTTSPPPPPS
jgi:hypothetical protein